MTHKKLASGQVASSTGAIYSPSGVAGMVKTILLHNTNTSAETVTLYYDGTAAANKVLKIAIDPDETLEWAFDHMLAVADGDTLQASTNTASKVNYHLFGAEE